MRQKEKVKILTAFYLRLPVIGFSIGRLVYTQKLCSKSTDFGKESAIVMIFLEVEASYAIVSNTFSALKAFTSNFNSGFGFGFTQHAGADDYAMSRMKKYGNGSAVGTDSRHDPSPAPHNLSRSQKSQNIITQDREVPSDSRSTSPLQLPAGPGRTDTQVRASPNTGPYNEFPDNKSDGSEEGQLENGIMRHTEYSVWHSDVNDEKPILGKTSLPNGRTH